VSRTFARENQLPDATGALVIGVQPGYPADVAGLSRGDILVKINQQPIDALEVLKRAHAAYEAKPEPVLVETQRNRQVSLYVLKP
jgi:serine protease Do